MDNYQPNQVLTIFDRWAKQNFQQNPILRCLSTCASCVDRSLSSRITLTLVQVPGAKLMGSDMYGISQGCDHLMVGLSQFYPPCESGDGTGARTRIVSLKGWCPDRLDDTAICTVRAETHDSWLALTYGVPCFTSFYRLYRNPHSLYILYHIFYKKSICDFLCRWQQAGYIPFLPIAFRTALGNTLSSFDFVIPYC